MPDFFEDNLAICLVVAVASIGVILWHFGLWL
jgi:hypothetical protein